MKKSKVVIGLSGGVDSSVSAALLKRAGFDLVGVFMKFQNTKSAYNRCCSIEASQRARKVANQLGIPFYVLNCTGEFKKQVIDYFLKEYKQGRTPNPCVVCNKQIKTKLLFKKMQQLGAGFIATGHYAVVKNGGLFTAKDKQKDQSYFLWQIKQKELQKTLFPLGNYTKPQVRAMAKRFGLVTYKTPESQEVCFVQTKTANFLKKHLKQNQGNIVENETGKVLGKHQGLWFYTIGQRKAIGLSGGPWFVVKKDIKNNVLIVSKKQKDLLQKEVLFTKAYWLSKQTFPFKAKAKIRYNTKPANCVVSKMPEVAPRAFKAVFTKPQKAVTPGQSIVFYQNQRGDTSRVLGGGVIRG